jgi:putative solute:sodium symporter small subunit
MEDEATGAPRTPEERRRDLAYWRGNRRIIAVLLSVWAFVSFGAALLGAEWLNRFSPFGVPLGFWLAQQGSIYVYVLLVAVYVVWMRRLDREHGIGEHP